MKRLDRQQLYDAVAEALERAGHDDLAVVVDREALALHPKEMRRQQREQRRGSEPRAEYQVSVKGGGGTWSLCKQHANALKRTGGGNVTLKPLKGEQADLACDFHVNPALEKQAMRRHITPVA